MAKQERQTRIGSAGWSICAGICVAAIVAFAPVPSAAQLGGTSPQSAIGEVLQQILVKVNGDIFTQTELEDRQIEAIRARGAQPATDAELLRLLQEVTPEVVSTAVDELLLMQRGRELGYELTDEQFDEMVEGIKTDNDLRNDEEFNQALASEGMTLPDLRKLFEKQMLINQVQQVEVMGKVTLTEVEAREYYQENIAEFTEPGTVTMREILVRVPAGASGTLLEAAEADARASAVAARERVLAGEEFAIVAISVSDAASKANGGLIGPLDVAVISGELAEVLDELEVDEVSEPIRSSLGYQVLRLEARTRPEPQTFEEVQNTIANTVFNDRRSAEYARFLNELREEADFEWKDERLHEMFDSWDTERAQRITAGGQ